MRLVIDSSVFVAAFRDQEPHSQDAFRLLSSIEKGTNEALIPVTVILEVVAAVSRRTQDSELGRRVGMRLLSLSSLKLVELTNARMRRYFDAASAYGLAGMDAIVVGVAQEYELPIFTFDRQMRDRAKKNVTMLDRLPLRG